MNDVPARIDELLADVTAQFGVGRPLETGRLWARWRELVGDAVANHLEPSSLREGVLRVRADSSAWATEARFLGEAIRSRANRMLAAELIAEVRVWVGPDRTSGSPADALAGRSRPSTRRAAQPGDDPRLAFENARRSWSRFTKQGSAEGRTPPGNREKPW
jgi:predicted nucleic acid-binding Zn ribbon protein